MNYEKQSQGNWFSSGRAIAVLVILAVIGILLFNGHQSHLLRILPYLLLLACPLMHFFMHRGHGKHGGDSGQHQ